MFASSPAAPCEIAASIPGRSSKPTCTATAYTPASAAHSTSTSRSGVNSRRLTLGQWAACTATPRPRVM